MRPLVRDKHERRREYVTGRAARGEAPADRIKRHARADESTGCWLWSLVLDSATGYGHLTIDGKTFKAHRVSYEAFVGPIPVGLHLDHLCRNRACVNPRHLEPVTPLVNTWRSPITNATKNCCPRGHQYDEANTYEAGGRRACRTCRKAYSALHKALTADQRAARRAAGLPLVDLDAYFAAEKRAA